jgi:hypothetical protein
MQENYDITLLNKNDHTIIEHIEQGEFFGNECSIIGIDIITYNKCYFLKSLTIIAGTSHPIKIRDSFIETLFITGQQSASIELTNCHVNKLVFESINPVYVGNIKILGNVIGDSLYKEIRFMRCIINLELDNTNYGIIDLGESLNVSLTASLINCRALGFNAKIAAINAHLSLNIKDSTLNELQIKKGSLTGVFTNSKVGNSLITEVSKVDLTTNGESFGDLAFWKCDNLRIIVSETRFNSLVVNECISPYLDISNANYSSLHTRNDLFEKPSIDHLSILNSSSISINLKGYFLDLTFVGATVSSLSIADSAIKKKLEILESNFSKSEFRNVSFNRNASFLLKHSDITLVKFNTIDWMQHHKLEESYARSQNKSELERVIQDYLSLMESYRQLKVISQSASNRLDILNFQAHEQRVQKEILWLKKECWDWILLWTNEKFNNYGLSFSLPLRYLFLFHSLFFLFLISFTNTFDYTFFFLTQAGFDYEITVAAIGDFSSTLFPVHSFEYLKKERGWPIIIDLLMRISSGYFIFYFLSATRKFHNLTIRN